MEVKFLMRYKVMKVMRPYKSEVESSRSANMVVIQEMNMLIRYVCVKKSCSVLQAVFIKETSRVVLCTTKSQIKITYI